MVPTRHYARLRRRPESPRRTESEHVSLSSYGRRPHPNRSPPAPGGLDRPARPLVESRWAIASVLHAGRYLEGPGTGGMATALTKGPAYHFEPAWSPHGRFVAFSVDINGNLEIGIVPVDGGGERIIASHPQVDIE